MLATSQLYVAGCQHLQEIFVTGMGKSHSYVCCIRNDAAVSVAILAQAAQVVFSSLLNSCLGDGETTLKITLGKIIVAYVARAMMLQSR